MSMTHFDFDSIRLFHANLLGWVEWFKEHLLFTKAYEYLYEMLAFENCC